MKYYVEIGGILTLKNLIRYRVILTRHIFSSI
nr:MAG TPA: hypothetical protein [Bacteriophage sp.]